MNTTKSKATAIIYLSRNKHRVPQASRITCQLRFLTATLALILASSWSLGQGTVNLSMTVGGVLSTRVYMPNATDPLRPSFGNTSNQIPIGSQTYSGALVTGGSFVAQLWAAPGADQPESTLLPAFPITRFRTGVASGTIVGVTATLTSVPVDCPVATVQMRVCSSTFSNNWEKALNYWEAGETPLGFSQAFNVTNIGGGVYSAPNLLGLRSFSLSVQMGDDIGPPTILEHPQSQVATVGADVTFSAFVSAGGRTTWLQWRLNNNTDLGGYTLSHYSTNLTLTLTNVQVEQAGVYSLISSNIYGKSISSNAMLIIGNPGTLKATRDDLSQVVLNWTGAFVLQSATNIAGPFTDLPGQVVFGPYTNNHPIASRFFRLRN